jgi:cytidine deaminase
MDSEIESLLIEQALHAREQAYAPYSNFKVGAALLLDDGESVVTGCNVENASYGLAICAERNAICAAVAEGRQKFSAIVVAATPLASPCGACRQFIVEFGKDIEVVSVDANDPSKLLRWSSGDLIPDSFEFKQ